MANRGKVEEGQRSIEQLGELGVEWTRALERKQLLLDQLDAFERERETLRLSNDGWTDTIRELSEHWILDEDLFHLDGPTHLVIGCADRRDLCKELRNLAKIVHTSNQRLANGLGSVQQKVMDCLRDGGKTLPVPVPDRKGRVSPREVEKSLEEHRLWFMVARKILHKLAVPLMLVMLKDSFGDFLGELAEVKDTVKAIPAPVPNEVSPVRLGSLDQLASMAHFESGRSPHLSSSGDEADNLSCQRSDGARRRRSDEDTELGSGRESGGAQEESPGSSDRGRSHNSDTDPVAGGEDVPLGGAGTDTEKEAAAGGEYGLLDATGTITTRDLLGSGYLVGSYAEAPADVAAAEVGCDGGITGALVVTKRVSSEALMDGDVSTTGKMKNWLRVTKLRYWEGRRSRDETGSLPEKLRTLRTKLDALRNTLRTTNRLLREAYNQTAMAAKSLMALWSTVETVHNACGPAGDVSVPYQGLKFIIAHLLERYQVLLERMEAEVVRPHRIHCQHLVEERDAVGRTEEAGDLYVYWCGKKDSERVREKRRLSFDKFERRLGAVQHSNFLLYCEDAVVIWSIGQNLATLYHSFYREVAEDADGPGARASARLALDHAGDMRSEWYHQEALECFHAGRTPCLRVCILLIGTRGDVQPFIILGRRLQELGHHVRICTHGKFGPWIEENGLEFASLGGDPEELIAFAVRYPNLICTNPKDIRRQTQHLEEIFEGSWRACRAPSPAWSFYTPDVLLGNPPVQTTPHIAERLMIPCQIYFTMPWSKTKVYKHPFAKVAGQLYNNKSSYQFVDRLMAAGLHGPINAFRSKIGLPSLSPQHTVKLASHSHVPHVYLFSEHVVPRPEDWPAEISVVGFMLDDKVSEKPPPKELVEFLEAGPPPVYIGFGSVVVDDSAAWSSRIRVAVKALGIRAIVSEGWAKLDCHDPNFPEGNENIFMLRESVSHSWLFPLCAAVMHHGGAGTTAAGLRAGRPTVIVSFFGDQPFWGECVRSQGVGYGEIPCAYATSEAIEEGLRFCLDLDVRTKAEELGEKLRTEDSLAKAVDAFHRYLPFDAEGMLHCATYEFEYRPPFSTRWIPKRRVVPVEGLTASSDGARVTPSRNGHFGDRTGAMWRPKERFLPLPGYTLSGKWNFNRFAPGEDPEAWVYAESSSAVEFTNGTPDETGWALRRRRWAVTCTPLSPKLVTPPAAPSQAPPGEARDE